MDSVNSWDCGKLNRWIGFVQGVLWKEGIFTIDDLREHVIVSKKVTDDTI